MLRAESALWLLIGLFFTLSAAAEGSISVSYQSGSLLHAIPWESADTEQPWAAKARNGGSFSTLVHHITPSWRRFGPATPNDISESIEALSLPLLARHPVTDHLIPILADQWYSDEQAGITYFHIDDDALWSDGIPVTSNDIAYTLQFLTDEKNGTPYQRQQLTQHISAIIIYDPEYFALVHTAGSPPETVTGLRPLPAHFYRSLLRWPADFDRTPPPVTGAYQPDELEFQYASFKRVKDWWGDKQRFLKYRFHPTEIRLFRSSEDSFKAFANGELDALSTTDPATAEASWARLLTQKYKIRRIDCPGCPDRHQGIVFSPSVSPDEQQALIRTVTSLLVPDHTDAPEITSGGITLYYPATQRYSMLNSHPGFVAEPPSSLIRRLQDNRYQAVLISAEADTAEADSALRRTLSTVPDHGAVAALPHISYYHYLLWEWIMLPETPLLSPAGLLAPFDVIYGGLFSINRKERAAMMDKPERREGESPPAIKIYPKK